MWSGAFMKISFFLGYPFHVISCSRFVALSEVACFMSSHIFFWLTDCVEPMAYGFLVLMTLLDLI